MESRTPPQSGTPIDFQHDPRIGAALPPAGNNNRIFIILGLLCLVFAGVWSYVFFVQKPRVAEGAITAVTVFPLHSELRQAGGPTDGVGGGLQKYDEVLVWVAMKQRNLTNDVPLYAMQQHATLTLSDGQELAADSQTACSIAKAEAVYPILKTVHGNLMPEELTLPPGKSAEGLALFSFPITPDQWNNRKNFFVSISYQWQRDLALQEPASAERALMPTIGGKH